MALKTKETFQEWLKELNDYANKWSSSDSSPFEDDETTRELFEDGEEAHNAFQELMRE